MLNDALFSNNVQEKKGMYKKLEEKGVLNVKGRAVLSPRIIPGCSSGCFRTSHCMTRTPTSSRASNRSWAS